MFPNIDIDTLLSKANSNNVARLRNGNRSAPFPLYSQTETGSGGHRPQIPDEEAPDEADGFDWGEEDLVGNELSDGMAALSLNPKGTGYFGIASSSVLLRALRVDESELIPSTRNFDLLGSPFNSQPIPVHITDTLVEAYFTYYHTCYPFIHEPTFRAQYLGLSPRPRDDVWEVLQNAVLALGAWCINTETGSADLTFYQSARMRLTGNLLETGSLPLVQALTLWSNYVQKRNKPNTAWNYLGLAVRMATGLGLHREFPDWKSLPLKQEMRRRAWWGLYIFDSGSAITFGRPIDLPEIGVTDTRAVMNVEDEDLTAESTEFPLERLTPTLYSGLIAQTQLNMKVNKVYNRIIAKPSPTAEEVLELNKRIDEFTAGLPSYFQEDGNMSPYRNGVVFAKYRLMWRYKNLRIIMFRPFVLQRILSSDQSNNNVPRSAMMSSPAEKECRRICLQNSHETIQSVNEFLYTSTRSTISVWYAVYFLFQACLIPLICVFSEPQSDHAVDWMADVETTKSILQGLSSENTLAVRFLDVIERLCEHYLIDVEKKNGIPTTTQNAVSSIQEPVIPKSEFMTDIYSLFFDGMPSTNGHSEDAIGFSSIEINGGKMG